MADPKKVYELVDACRSYPSDDGTKGTKVVFGYEAVYDLVSKLLDALDEAERVRDDLTSLLVTGPFCQASARDLWKHRAEVAESALEVAKEALVFIADDGPFTKHTRVARGVLAKLPRRRQ